MPTWPAHLPIIAACGLTARTFDHLTADGGLNRQTLDEALAQAAAGDVVLLHGCCHNPTGVDLDADAWRAVADIATAKGLLPLIDLAYPGLGDSVEDDVAGVRILLEGCENALVALSCSKSFGLYRDRTGALLMLSKAEATAANLAQVAAGPTRPTTARPWCGSSCRRTS